MTQTYQADCQYQIRQQEVNRQSVLQQQKYWDDLKKSQEAIRSHGVSKYGFKDSPCGIFLGFLTIVLFPIAMIFVNAIVFKSELGTIIWSIVAFLGICGWISFMGCLPNWAEKICCGC